MKFLSDLLPTSLVEQIGWMLVHSVWQGMTVALLLALALLLLRRRSSQARYVVCCLALAAMPVLLAGTFVLTTAAPPELPTRAEGPSAIARTARSNERVDFSLDGELSRRDFVEPSSPGGDAQTTAGGSRGDRSAVALATQFSTAITPWLPRLVIGWLGGILLLAIWNLGGWLALQRLRRLGTVAVADDLLDRFAELARRLGVSRPVRLFKSALVNTPVALGWLRPMVLVPASALIGLTPEQLDAILAHELAHVRRHDYLVNLLQSAVETILFYHPAIWWISRCIRRERENCCDDLAASVCGSRIGYAEALVTMEKLCGVGCGPSLTMAAGTGPLLSRVRRLVGSPAERTARAGWWPASVIAATTLVVLLAFCCRTDQRASANPPTTQPSTLASGAVHPYQGWVHVTRKFGATTSTRHWNTADQSVVMQGESNGHRWVSYQSPAANVARTWADATNEIRVQELGPNGDVDLQAAADPITLEEETARVRRMLNFEEPQISETNDGAFQRFELTPKTVPDGDPPQGFRQVASVAVWIDPATKLIHKVQTQFAPKRNRRRKTALAHPRERGATPIRMRFIPTASRPSQISTPPVRREMRR